MKKMVIKNFEGDGEEHDDDDDTIDNDPDGR